MFWSSNNGNAGLSLRGEGRGFHLATMNMAPGYFQMKIEPKETLSCLIPCLFVVFAQQLEILVTTLVILIKTIGFVIMLS